MDDVDRVIEMHRAAGTFVQVDGVETFVREAGSGDTVVLMHGLPASSFLYRKVIAELSRRGFRAVCFDLPGLGLSDRPYTFDYTIRGLGAFATAAVDVLAQGRFHLVVHDAGGPVGFELAERCRDRLASLTILNTLVEPPSMPFPGEVMARRVERIPGWARSPWLWRQLMQRVGILNASAVTPAELDAYRVLTLGSDTGAGYLRIMRALRQRDGGPRNYQAVVNAASNPYPVQVIWGALDPALPLRRYGMKALEATGLPYLAALPARHFLQEDQAPAISALIEQLAAPLSDDDQAGRRA